MDDKLEKKKLAYKKAKESFDKTVNLLEKRKLALEKAEIDLNQEKLKQLEYRLQESNKTIDDLLKEYEKKESTVFMNETMEMRYRNEE